MRRAVLIAACFGALLGVFSGLREPVKQLLIYTTKPSERYGFYRYEDRWGVWALTESAELRRVQ